MKQVLVLEDNEQGNHVLSVSKVLLLLRIIYSGFGVVEAFAFVQYIEMIDAVSGVLTFLGCLSLRRKMFHDAYRT